MVKKNKRSIDLDQIKLYKKMRGSQMGQQEKKQKLFTWAEVGPRKIILTN